ncbi:hypothetical protein D3C73_74310 [compost metagenome]
MRRLNVFFGENDTGKSNVMRALNLFFNGRIDRNYDFDFNVDFSQKRRGESERSDGVRKFSYVKVWFETPPNHKAALGDSFYVKRTWSQSSESGRDYSEETSSHIQQGGAGKQASLTRFLNKIRFTYIPAVKGRDVYSSLLVDAYNAIAEAAPFAAALDAFTAEIQNQTSALSDRLNASLSMASALAPPTDLTELFSSLDFETLVTGGAAMSLTRQRGDGIQARHIPEIMAFISEKDSRPYHLWGIEEPENSLSVNSALSLAKRLMSMAAEDHAQLFVTTHSPAFYLLDDPKIASKYFLRRSGDDVEIKDGTASSSHELMTFMGDAFYVPLVAEQLKAETDKREEAERVGAELRTLLALSNRPVLFVEGETEEIIVPDLLRRINPNFDDVLQIISLGGASHAEALGGLTDKIIHQLSNGRRCFVVLDSDQAGRKALPSSVNYATAKASWVKSSSGTSWRVLSATDEAQAAFKAAGVQNPRDIGICLEDCFPSTVRAAALGEGKYSLGAERPFVRTKGAMLSVSDALRDEAHRYYLYDVGGDHKMDFARWLIANNHTDVAPLRTILEELMGQLVEAA